MKKIEKFNTIANDMEKRLELGEHVQDIEGPFKSELKMDYHTFRTYMVKNGQGFPRLFKAWINDQKCPGLPSELQSFSYLLE